MDGSAHDYKRSKSNEGSESGKGKGLGAFYD